MKHFEKQLPEGYKQIFVVDAKNTKLAVLFNLVALVIAVAVCVPAYFIIKPNFSKLGTLKPVLLCTVMCVYIVLHELVHGAAYKLLTKEKLTFGITLSVAFCGVPNIYVYRKASMIALLAPFVAFLFVFGGLMIGLTDPWLQFFSAILLGLHVGGCSGDLYVTFLYLFKFKDETTLMQDTGPKQTFYVKKE